MTAPSPTELTHLLDPVHERAERFCGRLCTTRQDAEDLYHDAILAAWHGLARLADRDRFGPWFFQIIINTFRNRERRKRWRRFLSWDREDEQPIELDHHSVDPRGQLEARRWLSYGLNALSPDDRSLVVLFELEDFSVAELSRIWNCPEGTIKSRLSRARNRMRDAIINARAAKRPLAAHTNEVNYGLHPNPQTTD